MKTNEEILATWDEEGYYTDWYAIDNYEPMTGTINRLFVGTEEEADRLMRKTYAVPTDLAMQPFYRCSLISTSAAKQYFEGIRESYVDDHTEWISTAEAAEILGVGRARVTQLIKLGFIRAEKVGNRYSVDRASVEERAANPPKPGRRW